MDKVKDCTTPDIASGTRSHWMPKQQQLRRQFLPSDARGRPSNAGHFWISMFLYHRICQWVWKRGCYTKELTFLFMFLIFWYSPDIGFTRQACPIDQHLVCLISDAARVMSDTWVSNVGRPSIDRFNHTPTKPKWTELFFLPNFRDSVEVFCIFEWLK